MHIRFTTWQGVWPLITRHPLGVGLGTTGGASARFQEYLRFGAIHSDNVYLATFLETGWLGGGVLLALTLWIIGKGSRAMQARPLGHAGWVRLGIATSVIMMAIADLVTPVTWDPGVSHFFWLAAGMTANPKADCVEQGVSG